LKPQIALRAYELYEERDHHDGTAVQDWQKAEREIRNDGTNGQPKPESKVEDAKPQTKAEAKPEAKDKPQPDATPQLVKRVHELYEELGRKDVQSVQDWEKAHPEFEEHESHK
jgi:H+-transporting ATPase